MEPRNLPKVKIPDDLTLDEMKCIDVEEISLLANKMRRAIVDDNR